MSRVLGADIETYLAELVARLRDGLGERLVGAWLFGSGALGDFDPATSDLDVQVVTTVRLARAEREDLAARVSHPALACPVRGLELVLYARDDLDDPLGPAFQLNLNTGPRMAQHVAYDPSEDPRFWFVLDVAIGREAGRRSGRSAAGRGLPGAARAARASTRCNRRSPGLRRTIPEAARRRWRRRGPGRGPRTAAGSRRVPRRCG